MTRDEATVAVGMLTDPNPHLRLRFAHALQSEAPSWLPPEVMDEVRSCIIRSTLEIVDNAAIGIADSPDPGPPPIPRLRLASVDGRRIDENS